MAKLDAKFHANNREGILLSLLYLNHELAQANMLKTKASLDKTLRIAIKECMFARVTEEDVEKMCLFIKKAQKLKRPDLLCAINIIEKLQAEEANS